MLTRVVKECFTPALRIRCLAALLKDARTWGVWHVKLATNIIKAGLQLDPQAHVDLTRTLVNVVRAGVGLSANDATAHSVATKAASLPFAALLVAFLTNCSECAALHLAALEPVVRDIRCLHTGLIAFALSQRTHRTDAFYSPQVPKLEGLLQRTAAKAIAKLRA
jgi:hypothetical protein